MRIRPYQHHCAMLLFLWRYQLLAPASSRACTESAAAGFSLVSSSMDFLAHYASWSLNLLERALSGMTALKSISCSALAVVIGHEGNLPHALPRHGLRGACRRFRL